MSDKVMLSPVEVLQELALAKTMRALGEAAEELALEMYEAEDALLFLQDPERKSMVRLADGSTLPLNEETFIGASLLHCENLRHSQDKLPVPGWESEPIRDALAVPLRHYGSPVGVLVVINPSHSEFKQLEELAAMAAIVRESVARAEELTAFTRRTEELLVRAVEASEAGMSGHISRVGRLASEVAALMDLSAQSRQLIFRAASFHDVGKLVMVGQSQAESDRFHAQAGADYLRGTGVLRDLAPLVEAHHERYDGSGARGLKADQVPVEGWVLCLAEHFEEFQQKHQDLPVSDRIQTFFHRHSQQHHPAALDALGGLLVSGRLEQLLKG